MDFVPKTNWQDAPSTATPITAAELIRIENGVAEGARDSSDTQKGNVELATAGEMTTGTDTVRVPSVKVAKDYIAAAIAAAIAAIPGVSSASESAAGIVELASTGEMNAGTDTPLRVPSVGKVATYVAAQIAAAIAALPGVSSASESAAGIVELASTSEMTAGTDAARVPAVSKVAAYIATQIAAIPGVSAASESASGIVELASTGEMTTGTDAARVPAVSKVAAYVATQITAVNATITALSSSTTTALSGKADKSVPLTQFVDVSDATPTDLAVLRYNGGVAAYVPAQLESLYAPIDAQGRIAESAEPQFYVPIKVINEGEDTSGIPAQTVVLSRAAAASLVPTLIGSDGGGTYSSTADTITFVTIDDVEVDEYVVFAFGGGAEATVPIAHTVTYSGSGAAALTFGAIVASGTNAYSQQAFGRCTTRIPAGTTVTVQNGGQSNNIYDRAYWMVGMAKASGIALTSPLSVANTGSGLGSSPLTLSLTIGTAATANTLAIASFVSNPGPIATNPVAAPYQRSYAAGSGWTALGPYISHANATTLRGMQMQYRIYPASGVITATQLVTDNGSYGNAAWAASGTVLKGA